MPDESGGIQRSMIQTGSFELSFLDTSPPHLPAVKQCHACELCLCAQHAVTFAAGLACEGMIPFAAIYSSFLQRGYDQIVHDVCLQSLPGAAPLGRPWLLDHPCAWTAAISPRHARWSCTTCYLVRHTGAQPLPAASATCHALTMPPVTASGLRHLSVPCKVVNVYGPASGPAHIVLC